MLSLGMKKELISSLLMFRNSKNRSSQFISVIEISHHLFVNWTCMISTRSETTITKISFNTSNSEEVTGTFFLHILDKPSETSRGKDATAKKARKVRKTWASQITMSLSTMFKKLQDIKTNTTKPFKVSKKSVMNLPLPLSESFMSP